MKNSLIDFRVGSRWDTNNCGPLEIVEYNGCNNVLVRFIDTGYIRKATTTRIKRGQVKDLYFRSVFGVGYPGEGDFKKVVNGRNTKTYSVWANMIKRCYYANNSTPSYSDCTVCDEWHNYQTFAEWYTLSAQEGMEDYELDKDLKVTGNRIYSPEFCCLIPSVVNTFTLDNKKKRGETLIGVHYYKSRGKFTAHCANPMAKSEYHLGYFKSEIDAHLAWRRKKSEVARNLASIQKFKYVADLLIKWSRDLDRGIIHPYR